MLVKGVPTGDIQLYVQSLCAPWSMFMAYGLCDGWGYVVMNYVIKIYLGGEKRKGNELAPIKQQIML